MNINIGTSEFLIISSTILIVLADMFLLPVLMLITAVGICVLRFGVKIKEMEQIVEFSENDNKDDSASQKPQFIFYDDLEGTSIN